MRYTGSRGLTIDLVRPSPGGMDLEYIHPYTYAGNTPLTLIDPSGLLPCTPAELLQAQGHCIAEARAKGLDPLSAIVTSCTSSWSLWCPWKTTVKYTCSATKAITQPVSHLSGSMNV